MARGVEDIEALDMSKYFGALLLRWSAGGTWRGPHFVC